MTNSAQTLLQYLRRKDPHLNSSKCKSGKNTTSRKTIWDKPREIKRWNDFEYDALKSIYGGTLHELLDCQFALEEFTIPQQPFCQIHDENSLDSVVIKWNQSVISTALSAAQNHPNGQLPHEEIYMYRGGQAQYPGAESRLRPDWAGVKPATVPLSEPDTKAKNVLPGDTKPSRKWSSAQIVAGPIKGATEKNWFHPLSQVYTYCVRANARYGYIITDKELVVLRVRPKAQTDESASQPPLETLDTILEKAPRNAAKIVKSMRAETKSPASRAISQGVLEYRAIPWQGHGDEEGEDSEILTVNLALWWLHMMAAESNVIEERYAPLPETQRNQQPSSFSSSGNSQDRLPLAEKPPNHRLKKMTLGESREGKKRSRGEDEDSDHYDQESPQKRKTRSQK